MALPTNLIQRLKGFNLDSYDSESLDRLCESIVNSFLDESKGGRLNYTQLCVVLKDPISVERENNDLVSTIGAIIIRAASNNTEPESLKDAFVEQSSQENLAFTALLKAYSVC